MKAQETPGWQVLLIAFALMFGAVFAWEAAKWACWKWLKMDEEKFHLTIIYIAVGVFALYGFYKFFGFIPFGAPSE